MIGIRLLGGFDLAFDGSERSARLGSKPKGLIAFLAMNPGKAVSREKLVGLLWSGSNEANARHSLRQALTDVRSVLGQHAATLLQSSEDAVCLQDCEIELDVARFESLARSDEHADLVQACDLYRGEFLDGLEIREPEFEEWMLGERYRLGDLAASAFTKLMEAQADAGDHVAAVETARKLLRICPLDDRTHAQLIACYGALGQVGLAEAHYRRCCELFRAEIERDPGEEVTSAIVMARQRAQHTAGLNRTTEHPEPSWAVDRIGLRMIGGGNKRLLLMVAGAGLLLIMGAWALLPYRSDVAPDTAVASRPKTEKPSIAVLPFDTLGQDERQSVLARGITTDIITDLSKFSNLVVISPESSSRFKTGEDATEDIAQKLNVRYVLSGSLQKSNGSMLIHVNLTDAVTGHHVWSERFERPESELFALQNDVSEAIIAVIGSGYGKLQQIEIERIRRIPTDDLQAYGFFVRGAEHFWSQTKEDNLAAREMLEAAIATDPNYALALAFNSLTHIWDIFEGWSASPKVSLQKAEALARRAIVADPTEAYGYVGLGSVYQAQARREEAIAQFETAYQLNPNDFLINQALGFALTYGGDAQRGVSLLENARRLNPYHTADEQALAWAYFFAQRYQDALRTINKVKRHSKTHWAYKAAIHAELGQLKHAKAAVAEARKLDPEISLRGQYEERIAAGLVPQYAEFMTDALRKAGWPE